MFRRIILALALLLAVGPALADDLEGVAFSQPVIGDNDLDDLKGVQKVAIASFVVQYVTIQNTTDGGAQVNFDATLNADPAKLQALTEKMYQDFQTGIKAAGFELVSHDTLLATPEYKTMQEKSSATPLMMETGSPGSKSGMYRSYFYTPKGIILNLKGDEYENHKKGYSGFSNLGDDTLTFTGRIGQAAINWPYYDEDLQDALGAATLHVRVFIPIAYVWSGKSYAGPWTHYTNGSMAAVRLGERFTRLAVGHKGDIAKIYLTEDVMIKGITDAKMIKETTNLFGKVTGREMEWSLKMDTYEEMIPKVVDHTLTKFLAKMKENI
ncbi:MAG: hypothetical protein KJ795_09965 [Gammaproteobacteria bacterium]|nr:hypothetical protein [Gammaproteobacteria bacterium]MBU1776391.1 hypothetical protein [Gammaproteobacteria bacterium]MBU1968096.1 hypothetical protein [Gammaproteobacteria bacterium]